MFETLCNCTNKALGVDSFIYGFPPLTLDTHGQDVLWGDYIFGSLDVFCLQVLGHYECGSY